jgi:hypothetical protein
MKTQSTSPVLLDESSPSVQAHLQIIQAVISRMAGSSSSCKTWCITLVSAILVIVADKGKPDYSYLALLPALLFNALDTYYLALEKAFRNSYNSFVSKLHADGVAPQDLYIINPSGNTCSNLLQAVRSFSIWGFYISLVVMIFISRQVVANGIF